MPELGPPLTSEPALSAALEPSAQAKAQTGLARLNPVSAPGGLPVELRRALVRTAFGILGVTAMFAGPLWDWVNFAVRSTLFSHVLLIPLVSAYLVWKRPRGQAWPGVAPAPGLAALPVSVSGLLLAGYWMGLRGAKALPPNDYLSLMIAAYLGLIWGVVLLFLGRQVVRAHRFALMFLGFMIPWPTGMVDAVETALQVASAEVAHALLILSGVPLLRDGLVFRLPGITFEVAQECSGIRSSLVLLITSVVAAQMLLHARWRRWVLVLAVLPLGVLRNGFRILTIALLCVHVDPGMIDTPIHHQGGPIFFGLSLIPFLLLLWWLRRGERTPVTGPLATERRLP